MPPKRQIDATYHSPRGGAGYNRQEDQDFDDILLQNAWLGFWDDECSISENSPFATPFSEGVPSYVALTETRPGHVKTFEVERGQVMHDKVGFWKRVNKKTPPGVREDIALVPIPFTGDLWCWAYRFSAFLWSTGRREQLFALLKLETAKWILNGYYHEKYSYLTRDETRRQRGYSTDYFVFVRTSLPTPPSTRPSGAHTQSPSEYALAPFPDNPANDADHSEINEGGSAWVQSVDSVTEPVAASPAQPYKATHPSATSEIRRREPPYHVGDGESPTGPSAPSVESSESQEEESPAAAEALLEQSCAARAPNTSNVESRNSHIYRDGQGSDHTQKRRREYEEDVADDSWRMPPPPVRKHSRTTDGSTNGSPVGDGHVHPRGQVPSNDSYPRASESPSDPQERTVSNAASSSTGPVKPRNLARRTISTSSSSACQPNHDRAYHPQQQQQPSHTKEPTPAHYSPDPRRDSPMALSPSSPAAAPYLSADSPPASNPAASAASSATSPVLSQLPLRSSPAALPRTAAAAAATAPPTPPTPLASPPPATPTRTSSPFAADRTLFKIVLEDSPCEYATRLHDCPTVDALFARIAERLADDELDGSADSSAIKKLVFHTDMFVTKLGRPAINVPRGHEPSFSNLIKRLSAISAAFGERDVEIVVEAVVTRGTAAAGMSRG